MIPTPASGNPWLRINRLLRVMLHTRWSAEAWAQIRVEFRKALALRSEIRRPAGSTRLARPRPAKKSEPAPSTVDHRDPGHLRADDGPGRDVRSHGSAADGDDLRLPVPQTFG